MVQQLPTVRNVYLGPTVSSHFNLINRHQPKRLTSLNAVHKGVQEILRVASDTVE